MMADLNIMALYVLYISQVKLLTDIFRALSRLLLYELHLIILINFSSANYEILNHEISLIFLSYIRILSL
jgi:hypothetical protein